jgi:hypothetical protein
MSAAIERRSLADPEPGRERAHGLRAVGLAVSKLGAPILGKRGGGLLVRLKADWPAIVGIEWAGATWPDALGRDGGLRLRTLPAAALEIQHRAPLLIERINAFLGRKAVTRLSLVQGLLPLPPPARRPQALAVAEAVLIEAQLRGIADPELRRALARLGQAVIGAEN